MSKRSSLNIVSIVIFGIVGVVATVTYIAVTLGLTNLGVSPAKANVLGIALSTLVSYVGHHQLTFARVGDHKRHASRFIVSSIVLGMLSTTWTWLATQRCGLSSTSAALLVAIGYPPASYVINVLWTFRITELVEHRTS